MQRIKRTSYLLAMAVLTLSTLFTVGFSSAANAASGSDTCTWTGSGDGTKFSDASNWSGCSSAAPVSGDVIILPSKNDGSTTTLNNDLSASVALAGVTLGTSQSSDWTIYNINTLHFSDGATLVQQDRGTSVGISGSVIADGGIVSNGNSMWGFSPVGKDVNIDITNLTINDTTPVCMGGSREYTLTWKPADTVTLNNASYDIIGTESSITVNTGSIVSFRAGETYGGNITFNGGGSTAAQSCDGTTDNGSLNTYTPSGSAATATLSGTITLVGSDVKYSIYAPATLRITGNIVGSGYSLKPLSSSTGVFINDASSNNSSTTSGATTPSTKTLATITDSQPGDSLNVDSRTIVALDGVRGYTYVYAYATLKGNGNTGNLYVQPLGTVSPGHSPGCLTTSDMTLYEGSIYTVEIAGTKACSQYDQLKTNGTVQITNATLDLNLLNGYKPKAGSKFVIINNDGKDKVGGTFKGLKEGATIKLNDVVFKISYKGGDGNDVVLTVLSAPVTPDTGFAMITANPAITALATMFSAGAIMMIAKKTKLTSAKR